MSMRTCPRRIITHGSAENRATPTAYCTSSSSPKMGLIPDQSAASNTPESVKSRTRRVTLRTMLKHVTTIAKIRPKPPKKANKPAVALRKRPTRSERPVFCRDVCAVFWGRAAVSRSLMGAPRAVLRWFRGGTCVQDAREPEGARASRGKCDPFRKAEVVDCLARSSHPSSVSA